MGKSQRDKGKRGERATATELRLAFPHLADDIKRGWQARSGSDDPDVCGLPGFFVEVKSGAKPNPRAALEQAVEASAVIESLPGGDMFVSASSPVPIAVIRDDRKEPFCVIRWADMLELLKHHPKLKDRCTSR